MPKQGRDQFRGLPAEFPGREVICLPKGRELDEEYSCVSVYCAVPARGTTPGFVRVNLFASLLNVRSLIASAIVPVNFNGLAISAAGFLADSYAVYLQATGSDLEGMVALRADTCCATPGVFVPAPLQNPVNPGGADFADLIAENPAPFQTETGLYELHTEDSDPGLTVTIAEGQRVLGIAARAEALAVGSIEIDTPTLAAVVIEIEPGESSSIRPNGAMTGPATITFSNVLHFIVETVR